MKLFATFVAAAFATDCPGNSGWLYDSTTAECNPVGVTVTCTASQMTVKFTHEHLYLALDSTHVDEASSSATAGSCVQTVQSTGGDYTLTFDLDDCDTTVTQSNGIIEFSNTINGNADALKVGSIVTTSALSLDVSCTFDDSFTVDVDNVEIAQDSFALEEETSTGDFSDEFTLASYVDNAYAIPVNATNKVTIGEEVYNKLSVSANFPDNVHFFITSCTAYVDSTYDASGTKYTIINDGCMSNLVEADGSLGGYAGSFANFHFNGFTFDTSDDQLHLRCEIDVCAVDSTDKVIDSGCGYTASACASDETAATAITYA